MQERGQKAFSQRVRRLFLDKNTLKSEGGRQVTPDATVPSSDAVISGERCDCSHRKSASQTLLSTFYKFHPLEFESYTRLLPAALLLFVLIMITYTYLPAVQNGYMADDYIFLAQDSQHGALKSLIVPFKEHLMPFYRILVQASQLVSENGAPMFLIILGFHLLNTILLFHIVHKFTESALLSYVAAFSFGVSFQVAGNVIWVTAGEWNISTTFVLLMYLWFEKFLERGLEDPNLPWITESFFSRGRHLRDYYIGLGFFVGGLGIYTVAAIGGIFLWLCLYFRLLLVKKFRQSLRAQLKIAVPFLLILVPYLWARAYLLEIFLPFQDQAYQAGIVASGLLERFAPLKELSPQFYANFFRMLILFFPDHMIIMWSVVFVLLVKELVVQPKRAAYPVMWLLYALVMSGVPVFGRVPNTYKLSGTLQYDLPWWYFYSAAVGNSIALGMLLKPPLSWMKKVREWRVARTIFAVSVIVLLLFINTGKMSGIRNESRRLKNENRRFEELVRQYKMSMLKFLASPSYSPDSTYVFANLPAAGKNYFSAWTVTQRDLYFIYFPKVRNISFVDRLEAPEYQYLWLPTTVMKREMLKGNT